MKVTDSLKFSIIKNTKSESALSTLVKSVNTLPDVMDAPKDMGVLIDSMGGKIWVDIVEYENLIKIKSQYSDMKYKCYEMKSRIAALEKILFANSGNDDNVLSVVGENGD